MLEVVTPIRFHAAVTSGRTRPARFECEKRDAGTVEVVGKFSKHCTNNEAGLAMEVVAASLAADLELPVPTPYILQVERDFIETIAVAEQREILTESNPLGFGSTEAGNGFRIWSTADGISDELLPLALAIFCFDGFIVNVDRRVENPNLLIRGKEIRVIDHECSFVNRMLLGWIQPWRQGGLASLATSPGEHVFYARLRGRAVNVQPVRQLWASITDDALEGYRRSVPEEWGAGDAVDSAINLIRDVRDNIDAALEEVGRVLR